MKRSAFTAVETLMTLGIMAVTAGLAVPMWRNMQIRKDLQLATTQVKLALEVAQSDARKGVQSSGWGVYINPSVDGAVLFRGLSYNGTSEQTFPFPPTVRVDGLQEVAFLPVSGAPTAQGEIIFTSLQGDQMILAVTPQGSLVSSAVTSNDNGNSTGGGGWTTGNTGGTSTEGDTGETSDDGNTGDDDDGDIGDTSDDGDTGQTATTGDTGDDDDDDDDDGDVGDTSDDGDTGQTATTGDTGTTSGDGSGGGCRSGDAVVACTHPLCTAGPCTKPVECKDRFLVSADDSVFTTGKVNMEVSVIGADITYGAGGPEVDVRLELSKDNGMTWTKLFSNGEVDGGEKESFVNIAPGSRLLLKFTAKYQSFYHKTRYSNEQTGFVEVLRNGDPVPSLPAFANQTSVATYLRPYVTNGRIAIGQYDAIFLAELGTDSKSSSSFDLNDVVALMRFTAPSDSCGSDNDTGGSTGTIPTTGPRFKIGFSRLQNTGAGNAQKQVYVGPDKKLYNDGAWIPLVNTKGAVVLDGKLVEEVTGLAVERRSNIVRVLSHGTLPSFSMEIIDATVTFEGACVVAVENDTGDNKMEDPFNGIVNDTSSGDEVVIATDRRSVDVKTRVGPSDDAIFIQWKAGSDCPAAAEKKINICHIKGGKGTDNISFETLSVSRNAWSGHEGHGDAMGACSDHKEIQICHFTDNPSNPYQTLAIFESQWSAYYEQGDRLGSCTKDDDKDGIANWQDICPATKRKERPNNYLLWFRNAHLRDDISTFLNGPFSQTSMYTLADTSGCDCTDVLDIADGKPGSVAYKTPKLYFSLSSLPQFYIDTARKFGCTDSLVENVRLNTPQR
jgi:hypothetical protein